MPPISPIKISPSKQPIRDSKLIGQLLIVGFDGRKLSPGVASLLTRIQPAGVVLFARNIAEPAQTWRLLEDCQSCVERPLFTCVDLEGGRVDRFRDVLGPAPSAADVFLTGDRRLFRRHGKIIGDCCRALGFNTDFAPVVDLALEASQAVMSSRAVSTNPEAVTTYAREFLAGLRAAKVLGAAKHFPGLGEANLDTHHELPAVEKSLARLWSEDIVPYRNLRRHAPMVLVGHANYPRVTRDRLPASLSNKWITETLRKRIGYRGLIVSDDLEMGGVLKAAPIEEAASAFVRAGGDLCLICHREEFVTQAYEGLVHEAERDRRFARRVKESAARILAFKRKSAQLKNKSSAPTSDKVQRLKLQLWEFAEQVRLQAIAGARA